MNKIWLVLKNEFVSVVFRRSFLLTLFLLPLISGVIMVVVTLIQNRQPDGGKNPLAEFFSPTETVKVEGYVDASGLVRSLPAYVQSDLLPFASEAEALQALHAGEIGAYYLIPADYVESGRLTYVRPDYNPIGGMSDASRMERVLDYNLLNRDEARLARLDQPLKVTLETKSGEPQRDPDSALTFFVPYAVTMLFYIVLLTSSSLMLNSITGEKQNRVMEILMTSMTPQQMLTGKTLALGLVGLLQTALWGGAAFLFYSLSGRSLNLPESFSLSPGILAWGVVFFVLGYAIYGTLMAGLGALVPNLREASQATTLVILPLIVPLMLISSLIGQPNSAVSLFLSLFPLTSPIAMMTRLAAVTVPLWQLLLAVVLLAGTALLLMRSVAGMFRAQTLLSGQSFKVKLFFRALLGKA